MDLEKVLPICSICKSIKISYESDVWLKKETSPELYKRFCDKFEGRLSHGYCPECAEIEMKKL